MEGVHVEGHVVIEAFVIGEGAIDKGVGFDVGAKEIVGRLAVGVEYMGAVFVDRYAHDVLGGDIAPDFIALLDDKNLLSPIKGEAGEAGAGKAASDDEVIKWLSHSQK